MQNRRKPAPRKPPSRRTVVMIVMFMTAIIIGMFVNIAWPIVAPFFSHYASLSKASEQTSDWAEKERLKVEAIKVAEAEKVSNSQIAPLISDYADFLQDSNRLADARVQYQRSVDLYAKDADPPSERNRMWALRMVSWCDHKLFMQNEGPAPTPNYLEQALSIAEKRTFDPENYLALRYTHEALGSVYCDRKDYKKSLAHFQQAKELPKANADDIARVMAGEARIAACQGRLSEADQLFSKAVAVADGAYGAGSYVTEQTLLAYEEGLRKAGLKARADEILAKLDAVH